MPHTNTAALPNEIFKLIFDCLEDRDDPIDERRLRLRQRSSRLWPLTLVSHQWNRLSTPILYSRISVYFAEEGKEHLGKRGDELCRTLKARPLLSSHIEELIVWGYGAGTRIPDLLAHAGSSVRHLNLELWDGEFCDRMLPAIHSMDLLSLHLSGYGSALVINHLLSHKCRSSLLDLSVLSREHMPRPAWSKWKPYPALSKIELHQHYTSSVESLAFRAHYWSLEALWDMIAWPKCLKYLSLDMSEAWYVFMHCTDAHYTRNIQKSLNLQRESLEEIHLAEYLKDEDGIMVDLSAFPNLKSLTTHSRNLFQMAPEDAARKLAAPNLQRICIDTQNNDQQCESWGWLSDNEADWLVKFLSCRQQCLPASLLHEIHIVHISRGGCLRITVPGYCHWGPPPEEDLKRYASRLSTLGVTLGWPTVEYEHQSLYDQISY